MAKCKLDHCRKEAVPGGKRYCPEHLAAYKKRRAEYLAKQAALPVCDVCGNGKVTRGSTMCVSCYEEAIQRQRAESLKRTFMSLAIQDQIEYLYDLVTSEGK